MTQTEPALADLYEADETAWLDAMADLLRRGDFADLDHANLLEYLTAMAKRDRREVESRLIVLLAHVLKWVYQPDQRSRSWRGTVVEQRQELARLIGRGVLHNHAEAVLAEVFRDGVERAMAETDLPASAFPVECPWTVDELLAFDPTAE